MYVYVTLSSRKPVSFSRRTLHHGVSMSPCTCNVPGKGNFVYMYAHEDKRGREFTAALILDVNDQMNDQMNDQIHATADLCPVKEPPPPLPIH